MASYVRRHDNPLLRHRLERLERRHQLGQPHRQARKDEKVGQIIIALDLLVRDPTGKDDGIL